MELNIRKDQWVKVKLLDVFIKKEENDKENARNRFDRFLKVEHMDAESLHIKRWASQENGDEINPTFYKIFRKGQMLFPTRNPHLRRTVLASFDGICGEKTLTLEPIAKYVLPEFIPFLFHSEAFYAHTTGAIIGSTNPHVRWRDVANYEFLLPPKDQQAQLAELLWAMDEVVEREVSSYSTYQLFFKRYLFDAISGKLSKNFSNWTEHLFGSLGESYGGLSGKSKNDFGEGSPFINYMNVFSNSKIDSLRVDYVRVAEGENQNEVRYGDILITGSSETPEEVGMASVVLDKLEGYYLNSFCFGFRLNNFDTLLPEYARFLMRGEEVRKFMFKRAQGSTRFNLSKSTVKEKLRIILPSLSEQKEITKKLDFMEKNITAFETNISNSKALQKSLINQIF